MTRWSPGRRLFPPAGYGSLPFAVSDGEALRVFFSGRDNANRSYIKACSLDPDTLQILGESEVLVAPGPLGAFDDSGCSMSCVVRRDGRWFLYYTGWMLGRTVPFYLAVGLAISDDDGRTFVKHSRAPVLDRNAIDPFLVASPSILVEDGLWRMWYVSALEWERHGDAPPRHRYLIKYAESRDGITWTRDGRVAVPFTQSDEYAMGRPHVVRERGGYRMSFCIRGDRYRLAFAESRDGLEWHRVDAAPPPPGDWDAEMQAYPMTIRVNERALLFYNGNGYGATGFGCALAESGP